MLTRKHLLIILIVIVIAIPSWRGSLQAALSISPAFIELPLDKGRPGGQFIITNVGDEEERYRIRAIHFLFMEDGGLREVPPDEHSIAPWVRFNPKELTLKPKTKQTVRFVIAPNSTLHTGEYWGAMELESLKTTFGKGEDAGGRKLSIEVIPTILVPIFGTVGNVRYQAASKGARIVTMENRKVIESLITNTGEGRLFLTGEFEIINASGQSVEKGSLGQAYVLPGADRKFKVPIGTSLPDGQYTINVKYSSTGLGEPVREKIQLEWKP